VSEAVVQYSMFHSSPSSSLPSPSESQQPLASSHTAHAVAESTKICGHDVFFPAGKRPFSSQKSVISKALIALNKGHNALLESPTGTGKTLALLTSTLSWQQKQYEQAVVEYEEKQLEYERQQSRSSVREDGVKQEVIETKVKGSGDCVVKQEMKQEMKQEVKQEMATLDSRGLGLPGDGSVRDQAAAGSSVSGASGTSGKSRAPTPPKRKKIYFCARTHSQLQQVR
jgi:Rad3-related DNA helicase